MAQLYKKQMVKCTIGWKNLLVRLPEEAFAKNFLAYPILV